MEALTISAANLDIIEKNLGAVADELTGVIAHVNTVNNDVNRVQEKVENLNDEVKGLVKEIRETTIISNARQAIMYNNAIIEKKYGYYDDVRRTTESLLSALKSSKINREYLKNLREEIIMHNPNYWLSNALAALISWLLNDKENTNKEVQNALQKDSAKTSLFFSLINLDLNREATSLRWLQYYLESESPLELDKNFIVILDLVATGAYGDEAKNLVFAKINDWLKKLNSETLLKEKQIKVWLDFIRQYESDDFKLSYLENNCENINILKDNLAITSTYTSLKDHFTNLIYSEKSNKKINEILSDLIYEYEDKEHIYQNDNLKNQLIISCNGNREQAEELYQKEEQVNNSKQDLFSLLTNIVIYRQHYQVSNETIKIAISLIKNFILEALAKDREYVQNEPISLKINNFTTKSNDGTNMDEVKKDLNLYLDKEFDSEDKDLIVILLIINIIGIIGIFITLNNRLLSTILIAIVIIGNIILFYKLNHRNKVRTIAKDKLRTSYLTTLEKQLAQIVDYQNKLKENEEHYKELLVFINNLNTKNYVTSNNERNIIVGE